MPYDSDVSAAAMAPGERTHLPLRKKRRLKSPADKLIIGFDRSRPEMTIRKSTVRLNGHASSRRGDRCRKAQCSRSARTQWRCEINARHQA